MKKIYFASDFHLGIPNSKLSREREVSMIAWLDEVKKDAEEIFLVGDLFDFWFEYKTVVPRGYVRILGKLAEISDSGIPIHLFTGNHDMWIFDYLPGELKVQLHRAPITRSFGNKKFYIGHGDGLGPGDHGYKLIKKIFASSICQFLFRWIHPDVGIRIAQFWSGRSRSFTVEEKFLGEEKEWLLVYSKEVLKKEFFDYFIFGHRHLPLDLKVGESSRYVNLGEWINFKSYAVFDGNNLELKYWKKK